MSEERKRQLRTQGRFGGGLQISRNGQKLHSQNKRKDQHPLGAFKVSYEENSQYRFEEMGKCKVPKEILPFGEHEMSNTENGKSRIFYEPAFLEVNEGYDLFFQLRKEIVWEKRNVIIQGEKKPQPRLVAWYGPLPYSYSGLQLWPREIPMSILKIKAKVEDYLAKRNVLVSLNSVLANLYRDGNDSIAWHSDDEKSMGIHPTIASISLGETRRFEMRRKSGEEKKFDVEPPADCFIRLKHGSLLIMDGVMQKDWEHRVPKDRSSSSRLNLTFRIVHPSHCERS